MKKLIGCSIIALALASSAHATVLAQDSFNYADGNLATVSGGAWTVFSGAGGTPISVVSGEAVLTQGAGGREDDSISLGATMGAGDKWYYSLDVSVSGGNTAVYFAMLMQNTSTFNARLFVTPLEGSDYTFGVGATSSVGASWATGFTFGSIHKVVVAYDYDSGDTTLWIDPTSEASTSVTFDGTFQDEVVSFGFRQAAGNSIQNVTSFIAGTTFNDVVPVPEPSTYAMLLAGIGVMFWVVRRKRAEV